MGPSGGRGPGVGDPGLRPAAHPRRPHRRWEDDHRAVGGRPSRTAPTNDLAKGPVRHGDHGPALRPPSSVQPHPALRLAQAVGVDAQGRGPGAGDRQARDPLREGRLPGRRVSSRPAHHGGLRQGDYRRARALRARSGPARAARRHRRGGHQARPAHGARGGPGHHGRQARPDPVAADHDRLGRRGHLPQPGLPAGRVLDHLRRRAVVYAPLVEPDFHFDLDSLGALITAAPRC